MPPSPFRASGGSLLPDDPTYVKRRADDEFYTALKQGDYCYVLNSRQMGKSSLRGRTQQRLEQEGIACATLDLSGGIDSDITAEPWCYTLIDLLVQELDLQLETPLATWWASQAHLPPHRRFDQFLSQVLLRQISTPVVIFIDEIDTVLSLENLNRDDFFALIRACYNRRAIDPAYRRLTFALLGVATPADLIQDNERTPFNIGRSIQLAGFTPAEAQLLAAGLAEAVADPQATLQAILTWTGGQPFLTQKLCNQVLQTPPTAQAALDLPTYVGDLVRTHLITNWEAKDDPEHLRTIQTRLLSQEQRATRVLALYDQILKGEPVPSTGSDTQLDLRLSGLVVERQGQLQVYNPIYAQVFNADWVAWALAQIRPYTDRYEAWEASARQDDDCLLQGETLTSALAWAATRTLSPADYDFLLESQKLDLRQELEQTNFELNELTDELVEKTQERDQAQAELQRVNAELERVKVELSQVTGEFNRVNEELTEASHELIAARHDLRRVQRNTRRWSWIGAAVLATAMIGLVSSFVEANRQEGEAHRQKGIAAELENQANNAEGQMAQALKDKDRAEENIERLRQSEKDLTFKINQLDNERQNLENHTQRVFQQLNISRIAQREAKTELLKTQLNLRNLDREFDSVNIRFTGTRQDLQDLRQEQESVKDRVQKEVIPKLLDYSKSMRNNGHELKFTSAFLEVALVLSKEINKDPMEEGQIFIEFGGLYEFYDEGRSAKEALDFARSAFRNALINFQNQDDPLGQAVALLHIGKTYAFQEDWNGAISNFEEALKIAEKIAEEEKISLLQVDVLNNLGVVYAEQGLSGNSMDDLTMSLSFFEQGFLLSKRNSSLDALADIETNLYLVLSRIEEELGAAEYERRCVETAQSIGLVVKELCPWSPL